MCLGVPGRVERVVQDPAGMTMGTVSFGGIARDVCLAFVPEVQVGEYVVVHVGFAISRISEEEAQEVFRLLEQMGALEELATPPVAPGTHEASARLEAPATVEAPATPGVPVPPPDRTP